MVLNTSTCTYSVYVVFYCSPLNCHVNDDLMVFDNITYNSVNNPYCVYNCTCINIFSNVLTVEFVIK